MTDTSSGKAGSAGKSWLVVRRLCFGLAIATVTCGVLAYDYLSDQAYGLAVLEVLLLTLGMHELWRMLGRSHTIPARALAYFLPAGLVTVQLAQHHCSCLSADLDVLLIAIYLLVVSIWQLRARPGAEALGGLAAHVFAVGYLCVPAIFLLRVRFLTDIVEVQPELAHVSGLGWQALFFVLFAAKGSDVCAFFVGRFLGRRKLVPWISPGKTVAGAVGAALGGGAIGFGFAKLTVISVLLPWPIAIGAGILLAGFGLVGDLVESLIKRSTEVKDSGNLIPEFGGALDIIDSILFVAPVMYGVLWLAASMNAG